MAAAELPVKFQSDLKNLNPNLTASRLHQISRYQTMTKHVNRGHSSLD